MGIKGIVMTLDAIIAMMLMVSIISLLIFFRTESSSPFFTAQQLHSLSEDELNILSKSTLREVISNQTLLYDLNQSGDLSDSYWDDKAIEVIGMLWSENKPEAAASITKDILGDILPANIGYQALINNDNVYNSSQEPERPSYEDATTEISSGRIASGYQKGENTTGCVARAYLKSLRINDSSYVYFGGYVGDGNITVNITLPPLDKILEAYMEMDVGSNFTLYINNAYAGNYINGTAGGGLMRADKWIVCNLTYNYSICSNFIQGNNTLNFNFNRNNSFIGGGYFRVTYNTTQTVPQQGPGNDTYWFPGITGFFNLYDSFYVPGTLTNMASYLHYFNNLTYSETNVTVYLSIGNITVFRSNGTSEQKINLSFYNISQYFGGQQNLINSVSNNTVPLRLGFEEFQVKPGVGIADAVLITDVSDSMSTNDVQPGPQRRLAVAKIVDNAFIDTVLGASGNRVGLVSYSDSVAGTHPLSNNTTTLKGNISLYQAGGCTCTSCGINNATKTLDFYCNSNWNQTTCTNNSCYYNFTSHNCTSRFRGILVMSDGYANRCLLGDDCGIYGQSPSCTNSPDPNYPSKLEAINMSCAARSKGQTVFSVGFGSTADSATLQKIACWNCSACQIGLICNQFSTQASCQASQGCSWNPTVNNTLFQATFEGWDTAMNCSGSVAESWSDCKASDASAYWRAREDISSYNSSSTRYLEGNNIITDNSTWITKCLNLSSYSKAYVTFWYNKTATSSPVNYTIFHATFDNWDTSSNCNGYIAEGWNECVYGSGAVWSGATPASILNSSSTKKLRGSSISSGSTYITKCIDLSSYQKAYLKFDWAKSGSSTGDYILIQSNKTGSSSFADVWNSGTGSFSWSNKEIDATNNISPNTCFRIYCYRASHAGDYCDIDDFKIIGTNGTDEKQFVLINRTGANSLVNIWNSSTSASPWTYQELNITNYISSHTCVRYMIGTAPSVNKKLLLDDFKIIGTSNGICDFSSSCWLGNVTNPLDGTQVDCRAVRYAQSNNLDELMSIYQGFGQWFANLGYTTQKAKISGSINFNNILYPDSHIDLQYSPVYIPYQYGEISLTREAPRLGDSTGNNTTTGNNTYKEGWFNVSNQVVDAKITSYSSDYWTEMLWVNSSATGSWKGVYNLTQYGNDYSSLGDPFMIYIPANYILSGNNSVRIETGFPSNGTFNKTGGSPDDRVIYTLRVNSSVGYGNVNKSCEGAVKDAEQRLINITGGLVSGDIQNATSNISSVQYMWGPAIVRIRVWS